jgi:predicted anti-sigma-YlaC factor YlaD
MKKVSTLGLAALVAALFAVSGCSINRLAVRAVAGMLSGGGGAGGDVFTTEDDPELVGDALPFAMKLYESLVAADPENAELLMATGRVFVMYANAYVQTPADMLEMSQVAEQAAMRARAKRLFLRAREYELRGLELRRPGFRGALSAAKVDAALALLSPSDADYLYWTAAAWLSAFSIDPFDMELLVTVPQPVAMLRQVNDWDPAYGGGAVHDILISYLGSASADMGGSEAAARREFALSLELAKGAKAGPYLALATSVSVKNQDAKEFRDLLARALAIDVDKFPEHRLENILAQRRARWLLDHIGDLFLSEEGGGG